MVPMVWGLGVFRALEDTARELPVKKRRKVGIILLSVGVFLCFIGLAPLYLFEDSGGLGGLGLLGLFVTLFPIGITFSVLSIPFFRKFEDSGWLEDALFDWSFWFGGSNSNVDGSNSNVDGSNSNGFKGDLISIVIGLFLILSVSAAGIFFGTIGFDDEYVFGGPSPQLIDWQNDHQMLTGFDEFDGWNGAGVDVCMIDTGIEIRHPDLETVELAGWIDLVDNKSEPYDDEGHGTAMAGILVANGGLTGVAKGVSLHVVKALDYSGAGDDEIIAEAVNWCINQQTDIISMSLGGSPGFRFFGQSTDESENAVQDALDSGIFVVAAAGNDGGPDDDGDVESPGSIQRVICVGGHDRFGEIWEGSSVGDNNGGLFPPRLPNSNPDMKPEITAGGHEVPVLMLLSNTDGPEYGWGWSSGTSAATVFATGAIALALEGAPNLKPDAIDGGEDAIEVVKNSLMNSSSGGTSEHDDLLGYGKLNAATFFENVTGQPPEDDSIITSENQQEDIFNLFTEPKVLIIGIDGVRADVAEMVSSEDDSAFGRMSDEGAWTYASTVGPIAISGPSWSSMLTGVWCDRHGVYGNGFEDHKLSSNPDLIDMIESHDSSINTGSLVYWEPIDSTIIGPGTADIQERFEEDEDLHTRAVEILRDDSAIDVLFLAYDDPDYAGHRYGFSPNSTEYVDAVKLADERASELLEVLDERITLGEDWLVILTSDHGGGGANNYSHSPSTTIDRTTFMMVRGGDTISGEMYNSVVVDVAVTALTHMEIPLPSGSATLDGRPLAFEPNSEDSRIPNCDLPISATVATHAEDIAWASMGILLLAISTILIYIRRSKSIEDDESQLSSHH